MTDTKQTQAGRSMIEMLGVLAIIGVLSVGGIAGYSKAMTKFRINKTVDQIMLLATNVRTLYGAQKTYASIGSSNGNTLMINGHLVDDEMINGNSVVNAWGGTVTLTNGDKMSGNSDNKAFVITMTNIPAQACIDLATLDWGAGSGSGYIATAIGADATVATAIAGARYNSCTAAAGLGCYGVPMDPVNAATNCASSTGPDQTITMAWKFY